MQDRMCAQHQTPWAPRQNRKRIIASKRSSKTLHNPLLVWAASELHAHKVTKCHDVTLFLPRESVKKTFGSLSIPIERDPNSRTHSLWAQTMTQCLKVRWYSGARREVPPLLIKENIFLTGCIYTMCWPFWPQRYTRTLLRSSSSGHCFSAWLMTEQARMDRFLFIFYI